MRQIQGKLVLLRVSREFELPRVRVIEVQLYYHGIAVPSVSLMKLYIADTRQDIHSDQ